MPYIWKLLIVFYLLTGITLSEVKAQDKSSIPAELLRLEQSLWNDSVSPQTKAQTQLAKLQLYALLQDWNALLKGAKLIQTSHLSENEHGEFERLYLLAYLQNGQTHLASARIKKFVPQNSDTNLILLRAMVHIENYYWEGFAEELGRIDSIWKNKALDIASMPEYSEDKEAHWLPGYYFKNGRFFKGGISLGIHALPPAIIASAILVSIPISGFVLGGYLGWRIYGSEKDAIEQAHEKRNRQAVLKKQLAGYDLLKQIK